MKCTLGIFLVCVLGACAGSSLGEADSDNLAVTNPELSALQCGFGCGTGLHPVSYSCSFSCPGSCNAVFNQTDCQPNTGASYNSCTLGLCQEGYHPTSYQHSTNCRTSPAATTTDNNQSTCVANTGTSFLTCGFGCPTGYTPSTLSFNSACKISRSNGNSNNQTLCSR